MKLYRYSPIKSPESMLDTLFHVHTSAHALCEQTFGTYFPVEGNIVIFTHYPEEFEFLTTLRNELCNPAVVERQKYYELKEPIYFETTSGTPFATYTHLYIRRPDPYRLQVGDLDFRVSEYKYSSLKTKAERGELPYARVFPEKRLDMIELFHPDIDVLAYLTPYNIEDIVTITN